MIYWMKGVISILERSVQKVSAVLWISFVFLLLSTQAVKADGALIRVALFIDDGTEASEFRKEFRRSNDSSITYQKVDGDDIRNGILKNFDVVLIPGGSATTEAYSMGPEAREEIRRFIREGGIYLGVCAGAYLASRLKECYLGLLPLKTYDEAHWLRTTGTPLMDVEMTPAGMEVFGFKDKNVRIVYEDGPIFSPPFEKPDVSFTPLGFFRSEVVADGGVPGVMIGAPAMIMSKYGKGSVLVISPHPEETPGMKEVELHAIRWLYEHRNVAPSALVAGNNPRHVISLPLSKKQTQETSQRIVPRQESSQSDLQSNSQQSLDTIYGSALSEKALQLADSIFSQASEVSYDHRQVPAARQVVTTDDGTVKARTDCSGFISYIVHEVAPRHYQAIRSREPDESYPQAKIWARFFDTLDTNQLTDGWLGISKWQELRPGDIIAWVEGNPNSDNTGHVMMVQSKPNKIGKEQGVRYVEVPVIDSSSVYHFPPEQLPPRAGQAHRNGLGIGIVRIVLSDTDEPIGYWQGTYWGEGDKQIDHPTRSKVIRFARMMPLSDQVRSR